MSLILSEYADKSIDRLRVMSMLIIHDIIEIDAGDTYAYDTEGVKTKKEREQKAAERIFGLLPKDQGVYFKTLWEEFEEYETEDAKYAHLLDNFQPSNLDFLHRQHYTLDFRESTG